MFQLQCIQCDEKFISKHRMQKFCGNKCKYIYSRSIKEKKCLVCNKIFRGYTHSQKTCSLKCRGYLRRVKPKKCRICDKVFESPNHRLQKYCSMKCAREGARTIKEKTCPICSRKFYGKNSLQKHCSLECAWKSQKIKTKICQCCGEKYESHKKTQRYCSKECAYKQRYKKGMPHKKRGYSIKYLDNIWARAIKCKGKNKCEYCGKEGKYLNAHHIFSRSNRNIRWDLENGILLCPYHHSLGLFSAHKAPLEFYEWLKEKRGQKWCEELRRKSKMVAEKSTEERKAKIASELRTYIYEKTAKI